MGSSHAGIGCLIEIADPAGSAVGGVAMSGVVATIRDAR